MRREVLAANVVVVNHTLLFTLLASQEDLGDENRESGLLFPNDITVLDEAHTLEDVAARQLGMTLSQSSLRFTVQRLYNPRSRKGLFQATKNIEGVRAVSRSWKASTTFSTKWSRPAASMVPLASSACASRTWSTIPSPCRFSTSRS